MKTVFLSILLSGCQFVSAQKDQDTNYYKKYFFGNAFVKNGCELVVITKEPQTELAKEIGSRIYSDTATLHYMEQQFFSWKPKHNEIHHYCGFDLYFYRKKGDELEYFSCANSHCGISELGGGDRDMCSNIEFLAENGTKLVADTIYSFPDSIRTKSKMREVHFKDHIYSEFRDKNTGSTDSDHSKSARNVSLFYDGYIELKTSKSWFIDNEGVQHELNAAGIHMDIEDPRINWSYDYGDLTIYFTNDHPLFDTDICKPLNLPQPGYRFHPPLLLWKIP